MRKIVSLFFILLISVYSFGNINSAIERRVELELRAKNVTGLQRDFRVEHDASIDRLQMTLEIEIRERNRQLTSSERASLRGNNVGAEAARIARDIAPRIQVVNVRIKYINRNGREELLLSRPFR